MADRGRARVRLPRLAGAVCLLGGLLGGVSLPPREAGAAQAVPAAAPLVSSAWFWSQQVSGAGVPGGQPATLQDPTVPSGDLAVAGPEENGQPQKETYLSFDVSSVPAGSQILSFVINLPVDPAGTNLTPSGVAAPIVACEPKTSWPPGPAQPFSQKPADACASDAPKVTSQDGGRSYSVDIASIAQTWVGPGGVNLGVAITDDPANTSTAYQVVFGPGSALSTLSASVTYLPPASSSTGESAPSGSTGGGATQGPTPSGSGTTVTSGGSPSSSAGIGGQVTSPSALAQGSTAPATSAIAPTSATPAPASTTAPASSHSPLETAGRTIARSTGASSVPPVGFWLAGVLLLLMVAAAWLILQAPISGANEGPRRRRGVARLLDSRSATATRSSRLPAPLPGDA